MTNKNFDVVVFMMMLESGEITTVAEVVVGMVEILNRGLLSGLQGSYQRLAHELIEGGYIEEKNGEYVAV